MAQKATQRNNGSPKGYGQPGKRNRMADTLLRPEDAQMVQMSPELQDTQQVGDGQPPQVYPAQPQLPQLPTGPQGGANGYRQPGQRGGMQTQPTGSRTPMFGQPGGGFDAATGQVSGNPQAQQTTPQVSGIQDATAQSIANGYTDIQGMREQYKPGQYLNQLAGFNTNGIVNGGERGTDTLKNMMGTIFSNYDVSQPGALSRALPEIQKALPGATIVEHPNQDLLDPDGPNGPMQPVDVIQSATPGGGGAAWAWQPQDGTGGANLDHTMSGPTGPSAQAYQLGLQPQGQGQGQQQLDANGMPVVGDENSAMQFLQWLLQQQGAGAPMGQQPQGQL